MAEKKNPKLLIGSPWRGDGRPAAVKMFKFWRPWKMENFLPELLCLTNRDSNQNKNSGSHQQSLMEP